MKAIGLGAPAPARGPVPGSAAPALTVGDGWQARVHHVDAERTPAIRFYPGRAPPPPTSRPQAAVTYGTTFCRGCGMTACRCQTSSTGRARRVIGFPWQRATRWTCGWPNTRATCRWKIGWSSLRRIAGSSLRPPQPRGAGLNRAPPPSAGAATKSTASHRLGQRRVLPANPDTAVHPPDHRPAA